MPTTASKSKVNKAGSKSYCASLVPLEPKRGPSVVGES